VNQQIPPVQPTAPRSAPGSLEFTGPASLASSTSLRGSNILAATIQAPPLLGYLFAKLTDAARKRALEQIAEKGADMFEVGLEAQMEALGLLTQPPAKRLKYYDDKVNGKTPEMWAEQFAKYPNDAAADLKDYETLAMRAAGGELVAG
jgi:hypothetical protein